MDKADSPLCGPSEWSSSDRLVITEKCEYGSIEIGEIMTMGTRVDILEDYFAYGQHNTTLFFNQLTSNFQHKKIVSVALVFSTK